VLSAGQRNRIWLLFGALALSGVIHFALHQWGMREGDFGPEPHPAEIWLLRLHGLLAMLGLLLLGAVMGQHALRLLPHESLRSSGIALLSLFTVIVISAYGLYYGSEALHAVLRWLHLAAGLGMVALLIWHGLQGRALRLHRQARSQD
jgi:hypothetical protein